jgi:hypothetical protein
MKSKEERIGSGDQDEHHEIKYGERDEDYETKKKR